MVEQHGEDMQILRNVEAITGRENGEFFDKDGPLMSDSALGTTCDTMIPNLPLPEGKEYHVFISHDSNDRDYAVDLLDILEGQPYNLKCCFADRDFISGKSVIQNIDACMEKSSFILFLLTPDFLDSNYCDYERNVAQEIACSGEPHFRIVPVLLKECPVPRSLRFVSYIDARGKSASSMVEDKLYTAITKGEEEYLPKNYDSLISARLYPPDTNGNKVFVATTNGSKVPRSPPSPVVTDFPEDIKEKCGKLGIKVTDDICREICSVVNEAPILRYYNLLYGRTQLLLGLASSSLFLVVLLCSMVAAISMAGLLDYSYFLVFVTTSSCICPLIFLIQGGVAIFFLRRKMVKSTAEFMGKISQHSFKKLKFLVHIVLIGPLPTLCLVKYDREECKKYIKEKLLGGSQSDLSNTQAGKLEDRAEDVIRRAIPGYNELMRLGTDGASNPRHLVVNDVICLCQYVETENLHIRHTKEKEQSIVDTPRGFDNGHDDRRRLLDSENELIV